MQHMVLYCVLSGYAGLVAGWLLMGLMAMAARGSGEEQCAEADSN